MGQRKVVISCSPLRSGRWQGLIGSLLMVAACNKPPGPAVVALSPSDPLTTDDLEEEVVSKAAYATEGHPLLCGR